MKHFVLYLFFQIICINLSAQSFKIRTIAFYNLENLFDTIDDPRTRDDDFTPEGRYHWTEVMYKDKCSRVAGVINDIGREKSHSYPDIIGVAEIENAKVLTDIISTPILRGYDYGYIHEDSPDRRGIDVGLIYRKSIFKLQSFKSQRLYLKNNKGRRIYTRDQLIVTGNFDGELFCFIVNHWPSRRGGVKRSTPLREKAASLNLSIFDSLHTLHPQMKIISIGDFNDNPNNPSFKKILHTIKPKNKTKSTKKFFLYNPMEELYQKGFWSLIYSGKQFLFDQIFFKNNLLSEDYSSYRFWKASIYNRLFLITPSGKYKGYPLRSFYNNNYVGGYSDHLPVYIYLIKTTKKL